MRPGDDVGELERALRAADQPLDEVARLRMQVRILGAVGAPASWRPRPPLPRRGWWRLVLTVTLLAAGGLAVTVGRGRHPRRSGAPDSGAQGARSNFTHLEVPAGSKIHTLLAGRVRITLTGPAEADVISASTELVEIRLPVGVLLGDYDHRRGGTLRIDSPGATTDIVGTLFAVEASPAGSRVSVAHGTVRVRDAEHQVRVVSDGESWSSQRPGVGPLAPETQRLLEADAARSSDAAPLAEGSAVPRGPSEQAEPTPRGNARGAGVGSPTLRPRRTVAGGPPTSSTPTRAPGPAPASLAPLPSTPARAAPPAVFPVSPPAPRPEESAEALYRGAETAMRSGDLLAARNALERLVRTGSRSTATSARYELARLAVRTHDLDRAARILDEMSATRETGPLVEPARFLRCRIEVDRKRGTEATACARRFLQDFPRSTHAPSARQIIERDSRW